MFKKIILNDYRFRKPYKFGSIMQSLGVLSITHNSVTKKTLSVNTERAIIFSKQLFVYTSTGTTDTYERSSLFLINLTSPVSRA